MSNLLIRLLGTPQLILDSGANHVLERRDAVLLAVVAIEGAGLRSRVAALLWPDLEPKAARGYLRQRLFRLNRALDRPVLVGDDPLRIDATAAVDLQTACTDIAADPNAALGDLLGSLDYGDIEGLDEWVVAARDNWRRKCLDACAAEASRLEQAARIVEALRYAQRIVASEPLLEHAHRRLMRLHYLRGDRLAALTAFATCREHLARELGVAPDRETSKLATLIETSSGLLRPAPAPPPVSTLRPPRLIGVDGPWRTLTLACDTDRSVCIVGEAGAGNTRLLVDFIASRSPNGALFTARPGDARLPYALLAQVVDGLSCRFGVPTERWVAAELARLMPRLGLAPASRIDHLRLRQALWQALRQWAASGLTQIALDDLHYADDATLAMLPPLLQRGSASLAPPVTWLLGVRSEEIPASLRDGIAPLDERSLLRIPLHGLDSRAVFELIESLDIDEIDVRTWAPVLFARCGGNPLFLLETLLSLLQEPGHARTTDARRKLPLPATVRQLIARRLERLEPGALLLARVAAACGADLSVDLAAAVLKRPSLELAACWADLEAAQVLRGNRFVHDLVQDTTEASTPPPIAKLLHGEIAHRLSVSRGEPSRIARHWQKAERWQEAGESFIQAAVVAQKASQRRLELELAQEAADCFVEARDAPGEFAAREQLLRAAAYVEPFEVRVRRAEQLVAMAASPAQRCRALEIHAGTLIFDSDDRKIVEIAGEARALASAIGDTGQALMAAGHAARALARMARVEEAVQLVAEYLPAARDPQRQQQSGRTLADFGCALMTCDRVDEADRLFDDAARIGTAMEDWSLVQEVHAHKAWVHQYRGDIASAAASYEAARSFAPRLGADSWPVDVCEAILGRFYNELGRYAESIALLDSTLRKDTPTPSTMTVFTAEYALSWTFLELGQPARATAVLKRRTFADAAPSCWRQHLIGKARIAMREGGPAMKLVTDALEMATREGGAYSRLMVEAFLSRLLPPDEGAALALDACSRSDALNLAATSGALRLSACDALRRAGRAKQAAELARELMQRFERLSPILFYAPEYWWIASQAFADAGDSRAADEALRRAVLWIRETAGPHVPEEFRASFFNRNPVNVAVLSAASRV